MDKIKEYVELVMDKFGDNKAVVVCGVIIVGFLLVVAITI